MSCSMLNQHYLEQYLVFWLVEFATWKDALDLKDADVLSFKMIMLFKKNLATTEWSCEWDNQRRIMESVGFLD